MATWRKKVITFLDILAELLMDENNRKSFYAFRNGEQRPITAASLLELYQEGVLIQEAIYSVHCHWGQVIASSLRAGGTLDSSYYIYFLRSSGIDLEQKKYYQFYTTTDQNGMRVQHRTYIPGFIQLIGQDIITRRDLYYETCKTLTKDLKACETNAKNFVNEQNNYALLQKKLDDISKENESLRAQINNANNDKEKLYAYISDLKNEIARLQSQLPKLPSREEIYAQINQIQKNGEGTLEINIGGQPFRFVYINPGTYFIGIEDGEQATYMRKLSRNSMISVGMYKIKLNRGFFIMEDKISPQQLQAVYKAEAGNALTWLQANESAGAATDLFRKLFNDKSTVIRLPSEIEWECAMRGKDSKKLFPWGNDDPSRNPDSDVTELNIRNAASIFSEWCIDKYESYYFPVKTDPTKEVEYEPHGSSPYLTYYIRDNESIVQKKNIVENAQEPTVRTYRGASGEDFAKGLFANRAIPMRRSARSDQVNPAISFRFVLIPAKN